MSNVAVISASRRGLSHCRYLTESCGRLGIPLLLMAQEGPAVPSNDPALIAGLMADVTAAVEASRAAYIVLTDAHDVLAVRWNEAELIERIDEAGGLIISAEANFFPPSAPGREKYDADPLDKFGFVPTHRYSPAALRQHVLSALPWRYANGGQMCGEKSAILALLKLFQEHIGQVGNPDNQTVLHRLFGNYPMVLDRECQIFQSMYTEAVEHVGFHRRIVYNSLTLAMPMFLHFNGMAPGVDEWARRTGGK